MNDQEEDAIKRMLETRAGNEAGESNYDIWESQESKEKGTRTANTAIWQCIDILYGTWELRVES